MPLRPEWSVAGASGTRVAVRSLVESCRRNGGTGAHLIEDAPDLDWPAWARVAETRPAPAIPAPLPWVSALLKHAAMSAEPVPGRALLLIVAAMEAEAPSDEAACALAAALSGSGLRTVLLDLETPCGRLSGRLDLRDAPGMTDLLADATRFDAAIHRLRGSRLHIIPVGRPAALAEEGQVAAVFDALAETYDAVVLHVGATDEPRIASWPGKVLALVMRPASASSV